MTTAQIARVEIPDAPDGFSFDVPKTEDGADLWRMARDSRVLDVNSSYSYLLWCRDHATTSLVARSDDGGCAGFITGYLRPRRPSTLLVWQVAVDPAHRGHGLAAAMLDHLTARTRAEFGVDTVETTVTPDNVPSNRLFTAFAERHGAPVHREVLFAASDFPESGHEPEVLYRIGPLAGPTDDA
ncbi:diaminobutyrate acetyltransferase [Streptomyces calidiresistens]|uniref:L-2,4-diaminobutyric acid acetyltransferase n=1 Tax=Streptomyces calidiresistens TaxID=1485586 RepID=A0A7W3T420_9ACTN|nr:diaminobutyrate acetyltransferase [Streptomyces calidiresistens]MBB0230523.1 diaminobutyrate acetyltransferase [Streptomyces calidiresistens]